MPLFMTVSLGVRVITNWSRHHLHIWTLQQYGAVHYQKHPLNYVSVCIIVSAVPFERIVIGVR